MSNHNNHIVGASIYPFSRFKDFEQHFENLELQYKTGIENKSFLGILLDNNVRIRSFHLDYPGMNGHDSDNALQTMKFADLLDSERAVAHADYPQNENELLRHLQRLAVVAESYRIPIMVENVFDRNRQLREYDGGRNPLVLSQALDKVGSDYLGLCLDTGHSAGNGIVNWDNPYLEQWLKHMHLNYSVPEKHLGAPVTEQTDPAFVANVRKALEKAKNPVMIILENNSLEEAIESYETVKKWF